MKQFYYQYIPRWAVVLGSRPNDLSNDTTHDVSLSETVQTVKFNVIYRKTQWNDNSNINLYECYHG